MRSWLLYTSTRAIVKSAKLAPYQNLVYFVESSTKMSENLTKFEKDLESFLQIYNDKICDSIYDFVSKNYEKILKD